MPVFDAEIAEIVRSQKKDDEYIDEFTNSLLALAQKYLGQRRYVRAQRELTLAAPLAYYAVTTLCGKYRFRIRFVAACTCALQFRTSNPRRGIRWTHRDCSNIFESPCYSFGVSPADLRRPASIRPVLVRRPLIETAQDPERIGGIRTSATPAALG